MPSALREGNRIYFENVEMAAEQVRIEYHLLRGFFIGANENGLRLPINDDFRKLYLRPSPTDFGWQNEPYKWLSSEYAEIVALAQHYGIMTRMLDWTSDLFAAMYFASSGVLKKWSEKKLNKEKYDTKDSMVIWALDSAMINSSTVFPNPIPLKLVIPPYFDNPNLNAQKGILSYWEIELPARKDEDRNNPEQVIDRRPLDVLLQEHSVPNVDTTVLYKLEIPVIECFKMFSTLKFLGYTAAKLFPGYNGVVMHMKEETIASGFGYHMVDSQY